jgi:effector-binding domain-containing protein
MGRELFSIGDFSRMSRLSVKALRLYDQEGILRPGYVDPQSGYRYYSSAQLPEANVVQLLRSLELPLPEVREFLREPGQLKRRDLLDAHRERLENRLREYGSIISSIERLIEGKERVMEREVTVKEVAEQAVLSVRFKTTLADIGDSVGQAYGAIFSLMGTTGTRPAGPPFMLYHDEELKEEDMDLEACVPVEGNAVGGEGVVARMLSGGRFASTMHTGPYNEIGEAYQALVLWIRENDLESAGPFRDIYLVGPQQVADPADYRTEVVCPIA